MPSSGLDRMRLIDITVKLLGLSEALHRWLGSIDGLKRHRRLRLARYTSEIAASLGRMGEALRRVEGHDEEAALAARRELGRLAGYVEDVAEALRGHLDGRKIAGLERRLEGLVDGRGQTMDRIGARDPAALARLAEAEGYMRALSDRLRA